MNNIIAKRWIVKILSILERKPDKFIKMVFSSSFCLIIPRKILDKCFDEVFVLDKISILRRNEIIPDQL